MHRNFNKQQQNHMLYFAYNRKMKTFYLYQSDSKTRMFVLSEYIYIFIYFILFYIRRAYLT